MSVVVEFMWILLMVVMAGLAEGKCRALFMCPPFCMKIKNGCYVCDCGSINDYLQKASQELNKVNNNLRSQTGSHLSAMSSAIRYDVRPGSLGGALQQTGSRTESTGYKLDNLPKYNFLSKDFVSTSQKFSPNEFLGQNYMRYGQNNGSSYRPYSESSLSGNPFMPNFKQYYQGFWGMPGMSCPPLTYHCPSFCWTTDIYTGCVKCTCASTKEPTAPGVHVATSTPKGQQTAETQPTTASTTDQPTQTTTSPREDTTNVFTTQTNVVLSTTTSHPKTTTSESHRTSDGLRTNTERPRTTVEERRTTTEPPKTSNTESLQTTTTEFKTTTHKPLTTTEYTNLLTTTYSQVQNQTAHHKTKPDSSSHFITTPKVEAQTQNDSTPAIDIPTSFEDSDNSSQPEPVAGENEDLPPVSSWGEFVVPSSTVNNDPTPRQQDPTTAPNLMTFLSPKQMDENTNLSTSSKIKNGYGTSLMALVYQKKLDLVPSSNYTYKQTLNNTTVAGRLTNTSRNKGEDNINVTSAGFREDHWSPPAGGMPSFVPLPGMRVASTGYSSFRQILPVSFPVLNEFRPTQEDGPVESAFPSSPISQADDDDDDEEEEEACSEITGTCPIICIQMDVNACLVCSC